MGQPVSSSVSGPSATADVAVAEARAVSKRFGATVALDDVTLRIREGHSHALVGRNGAGKSTLVSVLTGMTAPDQGAVMFAGEPAPALADRDAWRRNVACVYQRSTIIPSLTVAENLFVNRQSRGSFISWPALYRRAGQLLAEYQVGVDPSRLARELDVETRQTVEIARALSAGARLIVLDEPTARLDGAASARLFRRMRALEQTGVTFLFISHHLPEIHEVCDTVTVLRDARHILTERASAISHDELVEAMTGETRRSTQVWSPRSVDAAVKPVLEVEDLAVDGSFRGAALALYPGEVVGVTGSGSSGVVALAECLVGIRKPTSGTVKVGDAPLKLGSVPASLAAGIGWVPQDRHREGLIPLLSVAENVTLPITRNLGRFGAINLRRRRDITNGMIDLLGIQTSGPEQPAAELSGGNQQKVVMGRALSNDPRVLVLIDPTAGVDVRSKESLLGVVDQGARDGRAVLIVTDDIEDLRCCDRVIVMFRGAITRELPAGWVENDLIAAIEGVGIQGGT